MIVIFLRLHHTSHLDAGIDNNSVCSVQKIPAVSHQLVTERQIYIILVQFEVARLFFYVFNVNIIPKKPTNIGLFQNIGDM